MVIEMVNFYRNKMKKKIFEENENFSFWFQFLRQGKFSCSSFVWCEP